MFAKKDSPILNAHTKFISKMNEKYENIYLELLRYLKRALKIFFKKRLPKTNGTLLLYLLNEENVRIEKNLNILIEKKLQKKCWQIIIPQYLRPTLKVSVK
jgi:hypothetical protein